MGSYNDVNAMLDHVVKKLWVIGQPDFLSTLAPWCVGFRGDPHRPLVPRVLHLQQYHG